MRILMTLLVSLVSSAIALLVAALLLHPDFSLGFVSFPFAVIVFAVILVVTRALAESVVRRHAMVLASFAGLIGTFVALIICDALSGVGIAIHGFGTLILATIIVWLGMFLANILIARRMIERLFGGPHGSRRVDHRN